MNKRAKAAVRILICVAASLHLAKPAMAQTGKPNDCNPESKTKLDSKAQYAFDNAIRKEPRMNEMQLFLNVPAAMVHPRILDAMLKCHMPIGAASGGVYEADYGNSTGFFGQYHSKAHVYVVPVGDSVTLVRFAATEESRTQYGVNNLGIDNKNSGTSGNVWSAMRNVFKQMLLDSAMKADRARSTPLILPILFPDSTTK